MATDRRKTGQIGRKELAGPIAIVLRMTSLRCHAAAVIHRDRGEIVQAHKHL